MSVEVGSVVGKYKIIDHLGRGGMSDTYRAVDTETERVVVLKVPFSDVLGDIAVYERYARERLIAQRLHHPNIQTLLSTGTLDGTSTPYTVLEYVEGMSLRTFLAQSAPLEPDHAVALALQAADILAYCHGVGVIHRDLKPENLIVTPDGQVNLLDFGIALMEGTRRVTWGPLSQAVGTPDYMAPEQVKGERGDVRTDVYALGVLTFEMLAGRPPYRGHDALSVMWQHTSQEAPALRDLVDVSPQLAAIVAKSLRRRPEERYQSVLSFVADLRDEERVDLSQFVWPDEAGLAPALLRPAGPLPTFWQATRLLLLVFATLAIIGFLAQLAHSAH